ncbi:peptidoglycan DD-metalloendopeptidase family protein [Radiobacillus kanasensis]|uniref:murein hydrolase activator EnvC family protein n=1 Tax=Radiobacillus kanasensis TaxID=2844358 RepID=UPI001E2A20BA|nr:M23 family metallopeptidase [Radiobacillus kanasensis]UFT98526.1 peptidoglycan DD-metalloendopeptidase family protein [Radiobacillus kanasensis]
MQMKRSFRSIIILAVALLTIFSSSVLVYAEDLNDVKEEINDLENQQDDIQEKQGDLENKTDATEEKIEDNLQQQDQVTDQIDTINSELDQTKANIASKEKEIKDTNNQIEKLNKDIEDLKERIKKREALLKDRLRTLQQSGGNIPYLEVLMGAQSFGDFLTRAAAVTTIMEQDKGILETQAADKKELETKQASLEDKKKSLVSQKEELQTLKATLDQQAAQKEKLMVQLEEEEQHLEDYKMSLQEQQETLAAQASIIEKAKKQAQAEASRLEKLAKEEAQKNAGSGGGSGSGLSAGGSGIFAWPAEGSLSSDYGPRDLGYHRGIDIANKTGTPIKAAASGVVARANWSNSYGNVVYIYHPQYDKTTVYAHMSSLSVSYGQSVGALQTIGAMGNTGNSYGSHLHFEVHEGGWDYHSGINPIPFLP